MARPKRADAVGNRLDQWFDRALGDLFQDALRVGRDRLGCGVANCLEALPCRVEARSRRRQAARIAALDERRGQAGDDAVHLALGHAVGQLGAADCNLVAVLLEHLDAGRRLRLRFGEEADDLRPSQGRLGRAEGRRKEPGSNRRNQNASSHGRSLKARHCEYSIKITLI